MDVFGMGMTAHEDLEFQRIIVITGSQKLLGTESVINSIENYSLPKVGEYTLRGNAK
jgi:hypothetical protein